MDHREDPRDSSRENPWEEPGREKEQEPVEGQIGEPGNEVREEEYREDAWGDSAQGSRQEQRQDPWEEPAAAQKDETVEAAPEEPGREGVYVTEGSREETSRPGQHYIGKAIVSIKEGKKIGNVSDIVINRDTLQVAAIITSKGAFFSREIEAITAEDIEVWGEDVILVAVPDVIKHESKIPNKDIWLNLNDSIRGRYVVSVDGTRVGQINDVIIDTKGRLKGYELGKVFIEGPVADSKKIASDATHSLGKDVLIVNTIEALSFPEENKD
jgi:uncharacterized protein YrrD